MKNFKTVILFYMTTVLFLGCMPEEHNTYEDNRKIYYKPVDPSTEPDQLSRILLIDGENLEGEIPESNSTKEAQLTIVQDKASLTAGNNLFIPFVYQSSTPVSKIYLSVEGALNFWDIPITNSSDKSFVLNLGVPESVRTGKFHLLYKLADSNGNIGNTKKMEVIVVDSDEYCSGGTFPRVEGKDGLSVRSYKLGDEPGKITIRYNTFSVPDRIDLRYGNQWISLTGGQPLNGNSPPTKRCNAVTQGDGFVGKSGIYELTYDPQISKTLDVYVSGCLDGGTAWNFQVSCINQELEEEKWYEKLPDCPCTLNEAKNLGRTTEPAGKWSKSSDFIFMISSRYHPGADVEYRWIPDQYGPGQQCTYQYDKDGKSGNLITGGIAAGTPDRISPGSNTLDHNKEDVRTWETLPCAEYLDDWPPNKPAGCENSVTVTGFDHLRSYVSTLPCPEIIEILKILNSNGSATIRKFGENGQITNENRIHLRDYFEGLISENQEWLVRMSNRKFTELNPPNPPSIIKFANKVLKSI